VPLWSDNNHSNENACFEEGFGFYAVSMVL
jgi:hypothetical protein